MALYFVKYKFVFEYNAFDACDLSFKLLKGLNWTIAS